MSGGSAPTRLLWKARDLLGRWFDLGSVTSTAAGPSADSLLARAPPDLRGTADDLAFDRLPFVPLYRTADEFAAEIVSPALERELGRKWRTRLTEPG